jgi:hypothetical protein
VSWRILSHGRSFAREGLLGATEVETHQSSQCTDLELPGVRAAVLGRSPKLPMLLRKEVIQPHLPVRLPCYDFTPIADPTFDGSLHKG